MSPPRYFGGLGEQLPVADLEPGDRVFSWAWSGGEHQDIVPLTVVRVNRKTVTVRTSDGEEHRVRDQDLGGYFVEETP